VSEMIVTALADHPHPRGRPSVVQDP